MDILYLKIDKNIKIPGKEVRLGQIADLRCPGNPGLEREAGKLKLPAGRITGPGRYVYSILEVLDAVQKKYPGIPVVNLGEADFILTLEKETGKGEIRQWLKTGFVCLLTFFGAAFSIMAFHNDVGITALFGQVYHFFTGRTSDGFTILELSYSLGLGAGILLFFNHFGKRKITSDPTPLEVEMRTYEDEIDTTLIESRERDEKEGEGA